MDIPFQAAISVLDQSPISEGSSGSEALRNTIDLARHADRLGFRRYWVAEHHGTPMLASAGPEVLIGPIAAATRRIRVGSGGVMLPHYSPLKVAENFSILSGLFPGRIDLGVGRAPGGDPTTSFALQRDRRRGAQDDFPDQLAELTAYLDGTLPPGHPFARLAELPGRPERPEVWLLGTSSQSAIWAGELGLPYACADFINPEGAEHAALYRSRFQPSRHLDAPKVAVALSALCAPTEAEARRLSASARMVYVLFREGRLIPLPSPETAQDFLRGRGLPLDLEPPGRRLIAGTPGPVRAALIQAAQAYAAEEIFVVTLAYDHAARVRSYKLIAGAFGLAAF